MSNFFTDNADLQATLRRLDKAFIAAAAKRFYAREPNVRTLA